MGVPLAHVLPLARENSWSDLLAVLIERDPESTASALGIGSHRTLRVRREYGVTAKDRPDLVLESDDGVEAVVEVKLLSGLGLAQLQRYRDAFPAARHHILISPDRLRLDIADEKGWRAVTWECLLDTFASSSSSWVAETAKDWRTHLDEALPTVGPESRWNGLADGDDFMLSMRARACWVLDHVAPPTGVTSDLVQSSAGGSWVVRVIGQTPDPHYLVIAEAEETLPVRNWPKVVEPDKPKPQGPTVLVTLCQTGVRDSKSFDWEHLHRLWQTMADHRQDWVTQAARPRALHDREAVARLRAAGAPPLLSAGYGDAQARRSTACMFGARFRLPADAQLREVAAEIESTAALVDELAQVPVR